MTVRTKIQELVESLSPFIVLLVCCITSLIIATNIRCHSSLTLFLYDSMPSYGQRSEFHWLGATHGLVVYLFVPLWCGIIDHFKLSYRLCSVTSGCVQLLSCLLSTGLGDPGYLIVTDSIFAGTGASIMLATIILVVDDHFPEGSHLRILATTLAQGTAFATFFLVDAYSALATNLGWRSVLHLYGASAFVLGLVGCVTFSRIDRPYQSLQRPMPDEREAEAEVEEEEEEENGEGGERDGRGSRTKRQRRVTQSSVIDWLHSPSEWKGRVLSLTQYQFESSRTILLWLLERLCAALVSDGIFLFLLVRSGITRHPYLLGGASTDKNNQIMTAFLFSIGSTSSYLAGGFFGVLLGGKLLAVYMLGALINTCSLIAWTAAVNDHYNSELVIAWITGFGVGVISTFAYAASAEATGIAARSVFPFTKLSNGLSIVIIEVIYAGLKGVDNSPIELLLLGMMLLSIAEFALLVLLRSKLNEINDRPVRRPF